MSDCYSCAFGVVADDDWKGRISVNTEPGENLHDSEDSSQDKEVDGDHEVVDVRQNAIVKWQKEEDTNEDIKDSLSNPTEVKSNPNHDALSHEDLRDHDVDAKDHQIEAENDRGECLHVINPKEAANKSRTASQEAKNGEHNGQVDFHHILMSLMLSTECCCRLSCRFFRLIHNPFDS